MSALPEENVHEYPRPPRLEPVPHEIRIEFGGATVARTTRAFRVLETTHPPTYYLPPDAFADGVLRPGRAGRSFCEWKGTATYWSIVSGGRVAADAAWSYPSPTAPFAAIRDHLAVYAGPMDGCFVAGERVTPQDGGFYGGWVTPNLVGPFKGAPGTAGW